MRSIHSHTLRSHSLAGCKRFSVEYMALKTYAAAAADEDARFPVQVQEQRVLTSTVKPVASSRPFARPRRHVKTGTGYFIGHKFWEQALHLSDTLLGRFWMGKFSPGDSSSIYGPFSVPFWAVAVGVKVSALTCMSGPGIYMRGILLSGGSWCDRGFFDRVEGDVGYDDDNL